MKNSLGTKIFLVVLLENICIFVAAGFLSDKLKLGFWVGALAFAVVSLIITGFTVFALVRNYNMLIREIKRNLSEYNRGNFTAEIKSGIGGTEGKEMRGYFETLRNMINTWIYELLLSSISIKQAAAQINNSSRNAEDGMKDLAGNLNNIRQFVEETTVKFTEIADETEILTNESQSIARNSMVASKQVKETNGMAIDGGAAVSQVVSSMKQIQGDVTESYRVIERLEGVSKEIGYIASTITSISEQTNLLALNAAIESARAGEHGRGFSVVAEEVRKLADETKQAAGKINELIESVQKETQSAVSVMKKVNGEVGTGVEVAVKAGESLGRIINMVEQVSALMEKISKDVGKQSETTKLISKNTTDVAAKGQSSNSAIQEVAAVVEEQLQGIQENTGSSNKLLELSQTLEEVMKKFDGVIGEQMLSIADVIAQILKEGKLTTSTLQEMARVTGLDEIHIADENGVIHLSTHENIVGFQFKYEEGSQANDFIPILKNSSLRVNQKAQFRALDGALYKYVAVSKLGTPGFVECGLNASRMVYFKGTDGIESLRKNLKGA